MKNVGRLGGACLVEIGGLHWFYFTGGEFFEGPENDGDHVVGLPENRKPKEIAGQIGSGLGQEGNGVSSV